MAWAKLSAAGRCSSEKAELGAEGGDIGMEEGYMKTKFGKTRRLQEHEEEGKIGQRENGVAGKTKGKKEIVERGKE